MPPILPSNLATECLASAAPFVSADAQQQGSREGKDDGVINPALTGAVRSSGWAPEPLPAAPPVVSTALPAPPLPLPADLPSPPISNVPKAPFPPPPSSNFTEAPIPPPRPPTHHSSSREAAISEVRLLSTAHQPSSQQHAPTERMACAPQQELCIDHHQGAAGQIHVGHQTAAEAHQAPMQAQQAPFPHQAPPQLPVPQMPPASTHQGALAPALHQQEGHAFIPGQGVLPPHPLPQPTTAAAVAMPVEQLHQWQQALVPDAISETDMAQLLQQQQLQQQQQQQQRQQEEEDELLGLIQDPQERGMA